MTSARLTRQHADLTRFLFEAKDHGYADIQRARPTTERDHSLTIGYESGDWRLHDNFFGGEPYGGRAVVFVKGRPLCSEVPRSSRTGPSRTPWASTAPSKTSGARRPFTETAGRSMGPASPAGSSTGGVASDGTYPPPRLAPGPSGRL
jgi:hypothetical protein